MSNIIAKKVSFMKIIYILYSKLFIPQHFAYCEAENQYFSILTYLPRFSVNMDCVFRFWNLTLINRKFGIYVKFLSIRRFFIGHLPWRHVNNVKRPDLNQHYLSCFSIFQNKLHRNAKLGMNFGKYVRINNLFFRMNKYWFSASQ